MVLADQTHSPTVNHRNTWV